MQPGSTRDETLMQRPGVRSTLGGAGPHSLAPVPSAEPGPLTLDPLTGPPIPPIEIEPAKAKTLGRSSTCEAVLGDESVSRRHATVGFRDGLWFVMDLGSTHGTFLNTIRLTPQNGAPIKAGDLIMIGPWTFRVRTGPMSHAANSLIDDVEETGTASKRRVERIQDRELAAITQQRLNLLMECAAAVAGVGDEAQLASTVLSAAIKGSGFPRAALLKDAGNDVHVIMDMDNTGAPGTPAGPSTFSKSLIDEARKGEMVKLVVEDGGGNASASIMMLKIQTALCAPIKIGDQVAGFLYLDTRAGETAGQKAFLGGPRSGGVPQDAATFVQAIAKMSSLAMGNLSRIQLEQRQAELIRDLGAAREAQQMIMPREAGACAGVKYAMRMKPGRMVAGDLFDVVEIDEHRCAVFLGDVAGKGISAAILMATAQTYLSASLRQHQDPVRALAETNRHVCEHASSSKFISLWLGVFDARTRRVTYVDAGHGYWMLVNADGSVAPGVGTGGIPLGIDSEYEYLGGSIEIGPGGRLVVFSDGVVEQPNGEGEQFQVQRAAKAVFGSKDVESDAKQLFDAVLDYAQTDSLADDTTVASVGWNE